MPLLGAIAPARVGPGRSRVSLVTGDLLAFRLDHAMVADAVRTPFEPPQGQGGAGEGMGQALPPRERGP
ncbi:MAG: ethanolamine ammonia-lyase subunit EutC [Deltaproteobacteria bacterium]|nr:ethanolamine ammonia-lyase subunit EutC [Deltaproteobacteria bacterium]